MTDKCGEIIGFLLRELLNELVDKLLYQKRKHDISSVNTKNFIFYSSHVFDAFHMSFNESSTFVNKASISKKYLFFR